VKEPAVVWVIINTLQKFCGHRDTIWNFTMHMDLQRIEDGKNEYPFFFLVITVSCKSGTNKNNNNFLKKIINIENRYTWNDRGTDFSSKISSLSP
jgi:hypothetical protein